MMMGVSMSIEDFNPWWMGRKYAEEDPDIVKWREMPVGWVPAEIEEISLKPISLNFLYGPRQVKKTTLVKLLVLRLLERVEPEAVFYFSGDLLSDYEELLEKDDRTVEDLSELDRISDLFYKEYLETGREDLIGYYTS